VSDPEVKTAGRWEGLGDALPRAALVGAAVTVGVGLVGGVIALASGREASPTMAAVYYIVGCILFLIGMFPSGGFSLTRGTMTRRRPIGSQLQPTLLLGPVLIAVGVALDLTRPF
jgi:hypothetical protein